MRAVNHNPRQRIRSSLISSDMRPLTVLLTFLPALVGGTPVWQNNTRIPSSLNVAFDPGRHIPGTEKMPEGHRPQMPAATLELAWLRSWNVWVWRRHRFEIKFIDGANLNRSDWEHLCWEWRGMIRHLANLSFLFVHRLIPFYRPFHPYDLLVDQHQRAMLGGQTRYLVRRFQLDPR